MKFEHQTIAEKQTYMQHNHPHGHWRSIYASLFPRVPAFTSSLHSTFFTLRFETISSAGWSTIPSGGPSSLVRLSLQSFLSNSCVFFFGFPCLWNASRFELVGMSGEKVTFGSGGTGKVITSVGKVSCRSLATGPALPSPAIGYIEKTKWKETTFNESQIRENQDGNKPKQWRQCSCTSLMWCIYIYPRDTYQMYSYN